VNAPHFSPPRNRRCDGREVTWGEKDLYIDKAVGIELARRIGAELALLPGIGRYPHLQDPERTAEAVRASFR
jgi:pimeloyl-ACP methyl ester carboxylesterase